jgi:hypothetical protein
MFLTRPTQSSTDLSKLYPVATAISTGDAVVVSKQDMDDLLRTVRELRAEVAELKGQQSDG